MEPCQEGHSTLLDLPFWGGWSGARRARRIEGEWGKGAFLGDATISFLIVKVNCNEELLAQPGALCYDDYTINPVFGGVVCADEYG